MDGNVPAGAVDVGSVPGLEDPTAVEHRGPGATPAEPRGLQPSPAEREATAARGGPVQSREDPVHQKVNTF